MWRLQFLGLGIGLFLVGALAGGCRGDGDSADPWADGDSSALNGSSETGAASPTLSEATGTSGATAPGEAGDSPPGAASGTGEGVSAEAEKATARQVLAAVEAYIKQQTRQGEGSLRLFDELTSEDLSLRLLKIQRRVYKLEGRGLFVRAAFQLAEGEASRRYELDFWVNYARDVDPGANADELAVTDTRIRSHPVQEGTGWKPEARYTFAKVDLAELK